MMIRVTDAPFNAKGDGITNDRAAIQAAIDYASANGGDTVVLTAGKTFKTSNLFLKSNVRLHFEDGAKLFQDRDPETYVEPGPDGTYTPRATVMGHDLSEVEWGHSTFVNYPFIYAFGAENIAITGKGIIEFVRGTSCEDTIHMVAIGLVKVNHFELSDFTIQKFNAYCIQLLGDGFGLCRNVTLREPTDGNGDGICICGSHDIRVSLQYQITGGGLKENILLADSSAAQVFEFDLKTTHLEVAAEDNTVVFYHTDGSIVYTMSAPWMMDANGLTSDKIALTVTGENNHYTVTLSPDMEWLASAAYPVVIDPILAESLSGTTDINSASVYEGTNNNPGGVEYNYGGSRIGREASAYGNIRAVHQFTLPSVITSSDRVIFACLGMTERKYETSGSNDSIIINVHQINSPVTLSTLTWDDLDSKYNSTILDSQIVTAPGAETDLQVRFNLTTVVRDWYQNGNNYGIVLISENENQSPHRYVSFYTDHFTDVAASKLPYVTIQYANYNGLEDSLTYHTAGNERMGYVNVSDFTGNMVYTFEDASTTGNYFPVSVSHIFDNSRRGLTNYNNSSSRFGNGFRINLYSRMLDSTLTDSAKPYTYKYIDDDGTEHYFILKETTDTYELHVDEFNPNRTVKKFLNPSNARMTYCLQDGSTLERYYTSDRYLHCIIDTSNNKQMTVGYIPSTARISTLTDGAGHVINLTYNSSNYLESITDPGGRVTTFAYTGTKLTTITRPGNRVITLGYDSDNCLTSVTDSDGSKLTLQYYTSTYRESKSLRRVKKISEYGTSGGAGQTMTFTYGTGETTVTDRDGNYETMLFDDFGHTVCVKNALGASYAQYDSGDKQNFLKYTTKMQGYVTNFVANGDFEDSTLSPWVNYANQEQGTGTTTRSSAQKYDGLYSMAVTSTSTAGRYGYRQPLTVTAPIVRTYTASAYVKITDITTTSATYSGLMFAFSYKNTDASWHLDRRACLQEVTDGWVRISHTFTAPADISQLYFALGFENASGTAYFDNVQVEPGAVANSYNYIDNGHFREAVGTAAPASWTRYSTVVASATDKIGTFNGEKGFILEGDRETYKNIEQTVVTSGSAGDKFTFSVNACAEGALSLDDLNGNPNQRAFSVRVIITNTDNTTTSRYFRLEPRTTSWQFFSGEVQATKAYSAIKLAVIYNFQKNTVCYKDFQLFKEGCNTVYTRDSKGRVTKETTVDGKVTTYTYVTAANDNFCDGRVSTVTYPDGTTESYTYYDNKQLKTHTDAHGVTTTYTYDANGNLLKTTATAANATQPLVGATTGYSGAYAVSSTDPFGNTVSQAVDPTTGLLNSTTDAKNNTTSYTYASDTYALRSVLSGNRKVVYDYDESDRLAFLGHNTTLSTGSTTVFSSNTLYGFTYDQFGNADTVKVGTRLLSDNNYAAYNGHLLKTTYGNGDYREPVYDALDRIVGMKYNGVVQYEQEYGAFGQIGLLRDIKNGMEYRYEYDTAGRLLRSTGTPTSANGFATLDFTNTYHPTKGWLTAVKRVIDGVARQSTYTYKTNGQLEKETFADGGSVTYYPDALGRVYSTAYKHNTTALFDRDVVFADDATGNNTTGRVVNDWLIATDWVDLYEYAYDENGNIRLSHRQTEVDGSRYSSLYTYDALNQLINVAQNDHIYNYTYDNGGNITRKVIDGVTTTYTYGDSGWGDLLTGYGSETFTYDAIGNPLTWRNGATFTWQGRQLQTATVNGKSLSYSYNADGIRTKKVVNGTATYYVLDGSKVVSQKTGTNDPVYFEYDATGKPVSMSYLGMVFYYVTNMQGDVIALVNSSGDKVVEYTYDPWGKLLSTTGLYANDFGYLNPFRYRGYYYDNETGFYYVSSRYYDPEIGRWINADNNFSNYNLFMYCGNNPVNRIDPNGEHWYYLWIDDLIEAVDELMASVSNIVYGRAAYERSYYDPKGANDLWNTRPFQDTKPSQEMQIFTEFMYDHDFVADMSVSVDTPIKNTYVKVGASKVLSPNKNIDASYVHAGIGTSTPSVLPINISYSVGIVNGVKAKENYAKHFLDIGAGAIYGFDYCWWPNGASAYSFTIGTSYGVYGGYDYYWCLD